MNRQFRFAKEKRISFRADLKSGGHQASSPPSSSSSPESGSSSVPPCKPSPEGSASPKDGGSCSSSMSNSCSSTNSLDSSTSSDDGGDGDGPVTAADYGLEEGVWGAAESSTNGTSTGPDALVFHISTLLLLGSLYVAAFLLRYAEVSNTCNTYVCLRAVSFWRFSLHVHMFMHLSNFVSSLSFYTSRLCRFPWGLKTKITRCGCAFCVAKCSTSLQL